MNRILIIVILALLITSCTDSTEPADENLSLKITPQNQTINLDDQAEFSVVLENAEGFFAFSAEILFNGNIISLTENSVAAGSGWGTNSPLTVTENEVDRLSITIGLTQTSSTDAINGDLTLFTFNVRGDEVGSSEIWFQNIYLIDDEGNAIAGTENLEIETGNITVE